jgi:G:T-mismatch repair DNA endonuclease (very short patch repair protein)
MKARYRDPEYTAKMKEAWNMKPNKAELFLMGLLDRLYPGEWKYTGDFSMTINGKCPDFVNCNGKKLVIEYFGDYWHQGHDPKERAAAFAPFGYKTIVIWGSEMKDLDMVTNRIHGFMEAHHGR